ncbi:nucleoside hydrolase [Streptomyces sp. S3(2020)]|uniref:nucleoside hydrolase n=1 Tax=Streptomyces sp. S3(2020) TaxID=2732044 RepID=UPI001488FE08|nr:nucleoside hydrolase [Streptomyces sp. S3(2020)]NNN33860.1 nucleoside hydrolase [Streptomyces sp. S3(2020)]
MGRLTNIALACALDPALMRTVGQVLWTGGAIDVRLTETELEQQRHNAHPAVRQACAVTPYYMDFYESILGVRECAMHCGLLLGLAMDPTLVREARHLPVAVELGGKHTRGMMVVDRRTARHGGQDTPQAHPRCRRRPLQASAPPGAR